MNYLFKKLHLGFYPLLIFTFLTIHTNAQSNPPEWKWAVSAGGYEIDEGKGIAVDDSGNVYITGSFEGTANFGHITLKSSSGSLYRGTNIFVAKLNNKGEWIWAVRAGGKEDEGDRCEGLGITVDKTGKIYVAGKMDGSIIFGDTTLPSFSGQFLAKLNNNGEWLWAINVQGSNSYDGQSISVDNLGNIYLTGTFRWIAIFGNTELKSSGLDDIFVAKLDTSGIWKWAVRAGDDHNDIPQNLALDGKGNIYITGSFVSSSSFDSIKLKGYRFQDIFAAKLDTTGKWLWAVKAGGDRMEDIFNIRLDSSKNVYISGYYEDTAEFGNTNLISASLDFFIAKLSSNGEWLWARSAGENVLHNSFSDRMIVDDSGYTYVTGRLESKKKFGNTTLNSIGYSDVFVAKVKEGILSIIYDSQIENEIIKLFPNPATNLLTIETSNAVNTPIIITDITGRQVLQINSANEKTINLDISSLSKGLYFVSIDQSTHKLIKD